MMLLLDARAGPTTESLLTHAHGCIALTIVLGTHMLLLLSNLRWCQVVAGCNELLVSFATPHVTLDRVIVNLAQSLTLLCLHF